MGWISLSGWTSFNQSEALKAFTSKLECEGRSVCLIEGLPCLPGGLPRRSLNYCVELPFPPCEASQKAGSSFLLCPQRPRWKPSLSAVGPNILQQPILEGGGEEVRAGSPLVSLVRLGV